MLVSRFVRPVQRHYTCSAQSMSTAHSNLHCRSPQQAQSGFERLRCPSRCCMGYASTVFTFVWCPGFIWLHCTQLVQPALRRGDAFLFVAAVETRYISERSFDISNQQHGLLTKRQVVFCVRKPPLVVVGAYLVYVKVAAASAK